MDAGPVIVGLLVEVPQVVGNANQVVAVRIGIVAGQSSFEFYVDRVKVINSSSFSFTFFVFVLVVNPDFPSL